MEIKRHLVALLVGVGGLIGALSVTSEPAHAAASGYWQTFDVQKTDRCGGDYSIWVASGYYQPYAWFDLNNDCLWDSYFLDTDGDWRFDQFWFDNVRRDTNWDTLIYGDQRWDNQNQYNWNGCQCGHGPDDPTRAGNIDTLWASQGFTSSTLGGTSPSSATAGGAFFNLMTALAARSGIAV